MFKTHIKILLHYVLPLQEPSEALANPALREILFEIIKQIGKEQGYPILCVGGNADHIHFITELGKNKKAARLVHAVQDITSQWLKQEYLLDMRWQESYVAVSLAQSQLAQTKAYIEGAHTKTFADEYAELTSQ